MIELLIGLPTIILVLGLFWAVGHGVAVWSKENNLKPFNKINIGFVLSCLIGLGVFFCWGVGAVVVHYLK